METLMPNEAVKHYDLPLPAKTNGAMVLVRRSPPQPSTVFDTYWKFASERQNIYFRRQAGEAGPWTSDPVLKEYKFTNTYRAADRTSQYLIRNVIYNKTHSLRDTVLRIILFKIFNKVETWERLENAVGDVCEATFDVRRYDEVLEKALKDKRSIYSAAYIMPSGPHSIRQRRKHKMHLELVAEMLKRCLAEKLFEVDSMRDAYGLLLSVPSIGPFLAYQFITDLNYSEHFSFSEMEFVVPGPGAKDGIRKCFLDLGDYNQADAIRWVTERQAREFEVRGLNFKSLWGRPLQLIDCQNVFCEVDKYSRVAHPDVLGYSGRTRIKQRYTPLTQANPVPFFPPKWKLDTGSPSTVPITRQALHG